MLLFVSPYLTVCQHVKTRLLLDRFPYNLVFYYFSKILLEKNQFSLNSDKEINTLHEDLRTLTIKYRSISLRIKNVSDKSCGENLNTHFLLSNFFFENHVVYEIIWKNIVARGRLQMTIWRMRIARWIPKATNTHSEYVTLITFPR